MSDDYVIHIDDDYKHNDDIDRAAILNYSAARDNHDDRPRYHVDDYRYDHTGYVIYEPVVYLADNPCVDHNCTRRHVHVTPTADEPDLDVTEHRVEQSADLGVGGCPADTRRDSGPGRSAS